MDIFEQIKRENNIPLDAKEIIFKYDKFEIEKKKAINFLKDMEIVCPPDRENALKIEGLIKDIENITEIEELFKIMLILIDEFKQYNIFDVDIYNLTNKQDDAYIYAIYYLKRFDFELYQTKKNEWAKKRELELLKVFAETTKAVEEELEGFMKFMTTEMKEIAKESNYTEFLKALEIFDGFPENVAYSFLPKSEREELLIKNKEDLMLRNKKFEELINNYENDV